MNLRFVADTDGETMVTRKYILIYLLIFFCGSLLSFISSASAQTPCTPVVYAFRHAEDLGRNLTELGQRHADLYIEMLGAGGFGSAHNYCPVGYVYSTYNINPDGTLGTNNPLETAQPVAIAACTALGSCTGSEPRMRTALGKYLYEYLGAERAPKTCKKCPASAEGSDLRAELIADASGGWSSAIFWTSQGLNILGQAIVPGFTDIPGCSTLPPKDSCKDLKAPRNAAYVFVFNGSDFEPPDFITQYVQCFNVHINFVVSKSKLVGPEGTTYYCGNGEGRTGNLPEIGEANLTQLEGKICDTSGLKGEYGYYGSCQ
jgi:hypothetical protein